MKDVARGIQMLHTAEGRSHRVYDIGWGRATSSKDIVAAVRKVVPDARASVLNPGRTPGNASNPATDLSGLQEVGDQPEHTLESGIAAYIDWLRRTPQ